MQELAVLRSCPTEQLQGILLNGARPFFTPRTFHNYQKSQFSSKVVKISLWKHLKRTLNSKFFLFVCFLDAGRFFSFFYYSHSPLLSSLMGRISLLKPASLFPYPPLLCISSQASMLPLKIKMCTRVQKLDAEPNVDHTLKEAKTLCKLTLHWEYEPKKNKKSESDINIPPRPLFEYTDLRRKRGSLIIYVTKVSILLGTSLRL